MALPLSLGLLSGGIARGLRHVKPTLAGSHHTWLSSSDASRVLLLAGAAAIMVLSLVLTLSRSGMAAMFVALALTGGAVTLPPAGRRPLAARSRRATSFSSPSRSRGGSASTSSSTALPQSGTGPRA